MTVSKGKKVPKFEWTVGRTGARKCRLSFGASGSKPKPGTGRSKSGRPGDGKWRAGVRAADARITATGHRYPGIMVYKQVKDWPGLDCDKGRRRKVETVNKVIVHNSASGRKTTPVQIDKWNREAGSLCAGYHFFIDGKAVVWRLRPLWRVGAHCKGHNSRSVGICLAGTTDRRRAWGGPLGFSRDQIEMLGGLIMGLPEGLPNFHVHEDQVWGHRDFNPKGKDCPRFDVGTCLLPLLCAYDDLPEVPPYDRRAGD